MPDPLLALTTLADDLAQARRAAAWFGASLDVQERYLILECPVGTGPALLARIDCTGYPREAPLVVFLDPQSPDRLRAGPSRNRAHWPPGCNPIERNGAWHLCLAGTRSYALFHPQMQPGYVMGLGHLVSVLALACKTQMKK